MSGDDQRVENLVDRILERLGAGPTLFYDLLIEFPDAEYRDILSAWGRIRDRIALERDEQGHYLLPAGWKGTALAPAQP